MVQQRFEDVMNTLVKYRNDMRLFAKEAYKHLITGMLRTFFTTDYNDSVRMNT